MKISGAWYINKIETKPESLFIGPPGFWSTTDVDIERDHVTLK